MLVSLIDERDNSFAVEIIEPATNKRKTARRKVVHVRREIDLAIEPRFDRVLIGRRYIDKMCCEQ